MLNAFWSGHDPQIQTATRQYMAAAFYHNDEQKRLILETKDREARSKGLDILTKVLPAVQFYLAEDYHQKYWLQKEQNLMEALKTAYYDLQKLFDSTLAARLNGYLAGYGTFETISDSIIDDASLPPETARTIMNIISTIRR